VDLIGNNIDAALRKALGGMSQPSTAAPSVMQPAQDIARLVAQHAYRSHELLPTSVPAISSQTLLDLLSHFGTIPTTTSTTAPAPIVPPTLSQILAVLQRN
jgi:hypothetical protein